MVIYLSIENYRSSLEEKIEQLNKFTDSRRIIESKGMNIQEFVTLADQLEQTLVLTMKDENGTADLERLSENGSDISGMSGETKISMHVQQVNSRYYSVQSTVKVYIFNFLMKLFIVHILAYHWSIKMYIGLPLVI